MSNDGTEVAASATRTAPRATGAGPHATGGASRAPGSVQSVDRALRVLEILADQGARGVTEIADELGVHKSTAFRLISVLEDHQLVEQVEERGRYHLGFGIVRLAGATSAQLDLTRQSQPVCEDLASALDETVNIAVLEGSSVINISQARGGAAIASHNWVGQLTPPHATSSGKVLLAALTDAEVFALLPDPLPRYTDQTLTSRNRLAQALRDIRAKGYGVTQSELEVGLNAVAAPVRGPAGDVIAALSVSGPTYRMSTDLLPELAQHAIAAAAEISRRLGYRPRLG
jgi:DNA-binding IclR family transcriptional regulator